MPTYKILNKIEYPSTEITVTTKQEALDHCFKVGLDYTDVGEDLVVSTMPNSRYEFHAFGELLLVTYPVY